MADANFNTTHRVTVTADSHLEMPELWLEVYVEGDMYDKRSFAKMFSRARCQRASSPEFADLVVFGGGEDVNPALYGEECHKMTHFNDKRDEECIALYNSCLEKGIPMFGVCRGAQFLHVMNGGKLWQHVDGHQGGHQVWDLQENRLFGVSSVHHQMCRKHYGMEVLLEAHTSKKRESGDGEVNENYHKDIEGFYYRNTGCFGVQGHPEYSGYPFFTQWCLKRINEFFMENPDFELRNQFRRMKPDLIARNMKAWEDQIEAKMKELN